MKTNVVDLRYKMKEVLNALNHRELVSILYHGQIKGTIIPAGEQIKKKVAAHPFFGMSKGSKKTIKEQMDDLRGNRYRDI